MIGGGVLAGRQAAQRDSLPVMLPIAAEATGDPAEQRQLQFQAPGGTRIIWVFNSEFDLKETIP
jgi:hypothetical protein